MKSVDRNNIAILISLTNYRLSYIDTKNAIVFTLTRIKKYYDNYY